MDMKSEGLPLGFGMALAQNAAAMQRFAALTDAEKQTFLKQTKQVRSKNEMQRLVASLAEDPTVGI